MPVTRINIEHELSTLREYLNSFSCEKCIGLLELPAFKRFYKQAYGGLVWDYVLRTKLQGNVNRHGIDHHSEYVADVAHATLLLCFGMYKLANAASRSAVENFIKYLCHRVGVPVTKSSRLDELFRAARNATGKKGDEHYVAAITALHDRYLWLNHYVHSAGRSFRTIDARLRSVPHMNLKSASATSTGLAEVCSAANRLDFILSQQHMHGMPPAMIDYVLDCYPKTFKRYYGR